MDGDLGQGPEMHPSPTHYVLKINNEQVPRENPTPQCV